MEALAELFSGLGPTVLVGVRVTLPTYFMLNPRPDEKPSVQRFRVMTQTLIAAPGLSQRVYSLCPVSQLRHAGGTATYLQVQEEHLVLWPDEDAPLP